MILSDSLIQKILKKSHITNPQHEKILQFFNDSNKHLTVVEEKKSFSMFSYAENKFHLNVLSNSRNSISLYWDSQPLSNSQFLKKLFSLLEEHTTNSYMNNFSASQKNDFFHSFIHFLIRECSKEMESYLLNSFSFHKIELKTIGNTFLSFDFELCTSQHTHTVEARISIDGHQNAFFIDNSLKKGTLCSLLSEELNSLSFDTEFSISPYHQLSLEQSYVHSIVCKQLIQEFKQTPEFLIRSTFDSTLKLL